MAKSRFTGLSLVDCINLMAENPAPCSSKQEFGDMMHDQNGFNLTEEEKISIAEFIEESGGYDALPDDF